MKKNLKILNMRYLDYDGKNITIGGVQTYITHLAKVARDINLSVEVFQFANKDFLTEYDKVLVHGVGMDLRQDLSQKRRLLYKKCMESFNQQDDLLLFATDLLVVKEKKPFALAVQHGIGWDVSQPVKSGRLGNMMHSIRQACRSIVITERAASVRKMVCVDYNYLNWYRTQVRNCEMEYEVIPNFSRIPPRNLSKFGEENIKIIFARRLVEYRGTRIFAEAIEKLLRRFHNIEVTIAGDGPDEDFLRNRLAAYENVTFTTYSSGESLEIHKDKHIAIVPSTGSEGTSLSLIEAMASCCAVVCTNIGGMTNIVIDHVNGLMVNPDADCLYEALERLVSDRCLRERLAAEAYNSSQYGFSLERWEKRWRNVLNQYLQ